MNRDPEPARGLMALIAGYVPALALHVAAKLDVAGRLGGGPETPEHLAEACGVDALSLRRVLRCLASLGVFHEDDDGRFRNSPMSEHLRRDHTQSLHAWAVLVGEPWVHGPWGHVLESVRTGSPVFHEVFGADAWSFLASAPEAAATFQRAMSSGSDLFSEAVLAAYPFGEIEHLVDVGGGDGSFLARALKTFPSMRGTLLERPEAAALARKTLDGFSGSASGSVSIVEGDFFEAVPPGGDVYLLKWIVHNWDDDRAGRILTRCREALSVDDAKILLVERVLPSGNAPSEGKILDLNMMVLHGGRERTREDFEALAVAAGLVLTKVVETPSPLSVIELRPESA